MTLQDLIGLYRAQAQDDRQPYFCSDELLTIYANEAQMQACRRGQLLRRRVLLNYAPGQESVAMPEDAIACLRARDADTEVQLWDVHRMDASMPNWQRDGARGAVQFLVSGLETDRLYLWPRPGASGQVDMVVSRMAKPMRAMSDVPEVRPEGHAALVQWMLYRAFCRGDTELFNERKAALALAEFEREFGRASSLRNETWLRDGQGMMPGPIA
ncbi:hypothetical protein EII18_03060 [Comamonadaceae bacterium OH3737_COT-264]|nr:hypothetical protein EII18_03060 [Comamonadaceae bacterium OH3737_COT-264]